MELTYNGANLLRFVLSHTGETEVNDRGQDVPSRRKLGGEESSQRLHFRNATEELVTSTEAKLKELSESHNKNVQEKRTELEKTTKEEAQVLALLNADEELKNSVKAITEEIAEIYKVKHKIEVTDKTKKVCKKYFDLFGTEVGYVEADDNTVAELSEVLK